MREAKSVNHLHQVGVKLVTRLRMKFSYLSNLKLCHKFKDCLRHMCNCGTEIGTIKHFFCDGNSLPLKDIISMTTFV